MAVPTHFFKVLVGELDNQQLEMEAYVLPNEAIPDNVALATFQVILQFLKTKQSCKPNDCLDFGLRTFFFFLHHV